MPLQVVPGLALLLAVRALEERLRVELGVGCADVLKAEDLVLEGLKKHGRVI